MTPTGPGTIIEAMATEFTLGARASCSDGYCGTVVRTILDPASPTVTHLVIEPRHHKENGRLVPIDLIEAGAGEIGLRCSMAEFERLEPAEESELAEGVDYSGGYGPDAVAGFGDVGGMGVGASVSGAGKGSCHPGQRRRLGRRRHPAQHHQEASGRAAVA